MELPISKFGTLSQARLPLEVELASALLRNASASSSIAPSSGSGSKSSGARCYIRGTSPALPTLQNICGTQAADRLSSDPGRFGVKPVLGNSDLQNVQSQDSSKPDESPGLDGIPGSQGCLLACPDEEESPQVPRSHLLGETFLLQGTPIRSCSSPMVVHDATGPGPRGSKKGRNPGTGLYRRPSILQQEQGRATHTNQESYISSRTSRTDNKLQEIVSFSSLIFEMGGNNVELENRHLGPSPKASLGDRKFGKAPVFRPSYIQEDLGKTGRDGSLYYPSKLEGKASFPRSLTTGPVRSPDKQRPGSSDSQFASFRTVSLDKHQQVAQGRKLLDSSSKRGVLDRCLQQGLGHPGPKGRKVSRNMGCGPLPPAHKCSGDFDDSQSREAPRRQKLHLSGLDGQLSSHQCGQKTRISLPRLAKRGKSYVEGVASPQCSAPAKTHSGKEKCGRRRLVADTSNRLGVATFSKDLQQPPGSTRVPLGGRPIRVPTKCKASAIRVPVSAPSCVENGRPVGELESIQSDLPLPTARANPRGSRETARVPGERNPGLQERQLLQASLSPSLSKGPSQDARSPLPVGSRGSLSGIALLRKLSRVQFLETYYLKQYSPLVAKELLNAAASSSNAQYESAWKAFVAWLPLDARTIDRPLILAYLVHLSNSLAPRTVLVHRNALRLPLELAFNVDFDHKHFSLLAKAHFKRAPPKKRIVPSWSLEDALDVLRTKCIAPDDIEHLLLKALFLTAVATANRASELAAIDRSAILFRNQNVSLGISSEFLFKNQTLDHAPSNIVIPGLDNSILCPVKAIRLYLECTGDSRESALFLHPGSGKPLNAGGVSFWLAKAISWLLPDSLGKGHDVRKLCTSLAWYRGVPAHDIVAAGSWKSLTTFIKRYLSNIRPRGSMVIARAIL